MRVNVNKIRISARVGASRMARMKSSTGPAVAAGLSPSAVKVISRSWRNGDYGANCGPSRDGPRRRAIRPEAKFPAQTTIGRPRTGRGCAHDLLPPGRRRDYHQGAGRQRPTAATRHTHGGFTNRGSRKSRTRGWRRAWFFFAAGVAPRSTLSQLSQQDEKP